MTLLLKMSRVGVNSESMENDEAEGVGDEGDTKEEGLSLSLLQTPRGRDGDGLSLSLDLTGSGRCVLERSTAEGRGEVWGDEAERNKGLDGFCRSILGARLLRGLLALFMYISISSARSRRAADTLLFSWSHSCTASVVSSDRGSNPVSIPVLLTVPVLQLTLLSTWGFSWSISVSSSSTPCSLSAESWCCFVELRWGTASLRLPCPPDRSRDFGLSVFGRTPQRTLSLDGLETSLSPVIKKTCCNRWIPHTVGLRAEAFKHTS